MQNLLAEQFASLQHRCLCGGAEDSQASSRESVNDTSHQRRFWTDHREVDLPAPCQFDEAWNVAGIHWHVLGDRCGAGIARCHDHIRPVAYEFPCEGMFTAATSNNEHPAG